jgi:hypothetical protein
LDGLSYTDYEYRDITFVGISRVKNGVEIVFTVKDIGKMDGIATVYAYVKAKWEGASNAKRYPFPT